MKTKALNARIGFNATVRAAPYEMNISLAKPLQLLVKQRYPNHLFHINPLSDEVQHDDQQLTALRCKPWPALPDAWQLRPLCF
jgi:hypothetical protein